jgi:cytochrome c-type biogenesis protein CcmH/NrfG
MKLIGAVLLLAALAQAADPEYERAHKLYNSTDFQGSVKVLQEIQNKDAAEWALLGRNFYMEGEFKKATESLEKAATAEPGSAEYSLWLARAFGRRAESSSPFTAPGLASKARQYFEKSVKLNPANLEAQTDLFEYYLEAPGFLGGGLDKAEAAAEQITRISPAEGYWAMARLAEKRKEYGRAEEQLRRAIEAAPHQVGRVLDLARFLVRQGRFTEAEKSLARAEQVAPNSPKFIFGKAEIYIKAHQKLDVAKDLLKQYMSLSLTPEDPPRSEAAKLLRQVQGG